MTFGSLLVCRTRSTFLWPFCRDQQVRRHRHCSPSRPPKVLRIVAYWFACCRRLFVSRSGWRLLSTASAHKESTPQGSASRRAGRTATSRCAARNKNHRRRSLRLLFHYQRIYTRRRNRKSRVAKLSEDDISSFAFECLTAGDSPCHGRPSCTYAAVTPADQLAGSKRR